MLHGCYLSEQDPGKRMSVKITRCIYDSANRYKWCTVLLKHLKLEIKGYL